MYLFDLQLLAARLQRAVLLARDPRNTWNLDKRMVKLGVECGELGDAVLALQGDVKKPSEGVYGEASDVILELLNVLAQAYPNASKEELLVTLSSTLSTKLDKWERLLKEVEEQKKKK